MIAPEHPDFAPELAEIGKANVLPDFGDGKDAGALRTIGEVANALGIRQHVLRYWEEQFPTLRPLTRAGGRRYYRPDDVALLIRINRLLHHEGYTIKGAKQALKGLAAPKNAAGVLHASGPALEGPEPAHSTSTPLAQTIEAIRDRLAAALED